MNNKRSISVILIWLCLILLCLIFRDQLSVEKIVAFVPENQLLAAVVMIGLFAAKGVSLVFYSGILYAVDGIIFSLPMAIVVNTLGSVVMIMLPFFLARKTGEELMGQLVEKYPRMDILGRSKGSEVFLCFLARSIFLLPRDPVSIYFGASGIDWKKHLTGSMLGIFPMLVIFSFLGSSVNDKNSAAFIVCVCAQIAWMLFSLLMYYFWKKKTDA